MSRKEWNRLLTADQNPFGEQQFPREIELGGNVLKATRTTDGLNIMVEYLWVETPQTADLGDKAA